MNSIRPLVTITILAVVGIFLYIKINQAPMRPLAGAETASHDHTAEGVPPLDDATNPAATGTQSAASTTTLAPQWPSGPGANAPPRYTASEPSRSQTPAIPELPELPTAPTTGAAPALSPAAGRAADDPMARYGSNSTAGSLDTPPLGFDEKTAGTSTASSTTPSDIPNGPGLSLTPTAPSTSSTAASEHDSAAESAMEAMGLKPQPNATPATPAAPTAPASPVATGGDRYGAAPSANPPTSNDRYGATSNVGGPSSPTTTPDIASIPPMTNPLGAAVNPPRSFATSWPAIQASLQKGELVRAHTLLSPWYNDPSLSPAESQQVESLLGQLAGTVIYSTEHRLEPPYVVRPGETLEDIARQHNVPWQLLGKINGVQGASQLPPGQQLKVVRGPFEGELDLRRNQLALKIDGRYAGKFPVSAPADVSFPPGDWVVQDKPTAPAPQTSVYGTSPGAMPTVSRSLLLRSASATAANPGIPVQIGAGPDADATASAMNGLRSAGQSPPYLVKVSPRDAEELSDILSIGSRVVIRR